MKKQTRSILEAMRYYVDKSAKLMPGGHDDEYTADKEEESDQLVEYTRTSVIVNNSTKTEAGYRKDPGQFDNHVENNKQFESHVQLCIPSGELGKGDCRYSVYDARADNLLIFQLPCPPTDPASPS